MRSLQKPQTQTLGAILSYLEHGQYVIPDFQREFEWAPWDIRDLVKSIFLDYFIGSLLMWKGTKQSFQNLSCESIFGVESSQNPNLIVLDGQQRLTAINYAFRAPNKPLPSRKSAAVYFIHVDHLCNEQHDEAFSYEWRSKSVDALLEDQERQFQTHTFPCALIGAKGFALSNWLQGYEIYWSRRATELSDTDTPAVDEARQSVMNAKHFSDLVSTLLHSYQVSYIELDSDLPIDVVCDIFTKLNSKGVRLDVFDLLNALLKPRGIQLKEMWRQSKDRLDFIENNKLNIYVLQVFSILRQEYCSPKYLYYLIPGSARKVRDSTFQKSDRIVVEDEVDFLTGWTQAVDALEFAIKTVRSPQEYGAIGSRFVPYTGIFPILAALLETVHHLPTDKQLSANDKIRQWYWASVFNNRYSGSTESTSAADFREVRQWFESDDRKPEWIIRLGNNLDGLDLKNIYNTGSSTYKGVFNLLIRSGARDWSTGMVPDYEQLDDHHIVPQAWQDNLSNKQMINSVLNRTPLSSSTNRRVVRDRLPNEYIKELIEINGHDAVEKIMRSHLISRAAVDILLREPFTENDFNEFLEERRESIKQALRESLLSRVETVPTELRELDEQVRQVELGLRHMINSRLHGDPNQLPTHMVGSIRERLDRESKKNPLITSNRHILADLLEYSDLRDLHQVIINKACWHLFEDPFRNKMELESRFEKLASLRNAIRHDRMTTSQTRIDGSASIHWFQGILARFGDDDFVIDEDVPSQSEE